MRQDDVENHGNQASGTRGRTETISPRLCEGQESSQPLGLVWDCAAWSSSGGASACASPPGSCCIPGKRGQEQQGGRENQQAVADELQCQLSLSQGQTPTGIHRAENLYDPKKTSICSGMQ